MSGGQATFQTSDGLRLALHGWNAEADTSRPPVLLHHGFAASTVTNWEVPGIVQALVDDGRRVIGIDARGHGLSDGPTDPALYGEVRLAADIGELLDHLAVPVVDLAGYSMGAVTALIFAANHGRVRRLWLGGIGEAVIDLGGVETRLLPPGALIAALEADERPVDMHPGVAEFRIFAERTGANMKALAAQARALNTSPIALDRITVPTMLVAGDADPLAQRPERLVAALASADLLVLPGKHLGVVSHPGLAASLVSFLGTG